MKHSNRNEVNMVICPKCGKVYHWSKKRCPECGHPQYPIYKNPVLLLMDDTLNFTKETTDNTIHYMGWEITLQTVEGNQAPEYINKSDFPR